MSYNLGKIRRVTDLRSIWPHEALDFTKWLCEEDNLAILSEEIGIDIELQERESGVGKFNVDIYAKESNTDRKIIIENQLEDSNHDHLGKIITYASGKDAEVIIWIVKKARDEHRQAIEWLNQHTDNKIVFFLLEIQLWQIDDSISAPKFCIIESPNEWAKTEKEAEGWNARQHFNCEYWTGFKDYASEKHPDLFPKLTHKANPDNWYDVSIGNRYCFISLNITATKKTIDAGIYIPDNKEFYHQMLDHKDEIESSIGAKLTWREATKASRFINYEKINVSDKKTWPQCWEWHCQQCLKIFNMISKVRDVFM